MKSLLALIKFVETYPVTGTALLTLVVAGILGLIKLINNIINENKKYPYTSPYYFGLSKNFYITTVLELFPDDSPSGYRQIQFSRPDQWRQKVIKVTFFKLIHKIVPLNEKDILIIMVRKRKKEKNITFNRYSLR